MLPAIFFTTGICIAFFLDFILISKKGKTLADKILVVWLFFMGLHLLLYYLNFTGKAFKMPWLLGINFPMPLLHGPFLFLYTGALTNQFKFKGIRWMLHFIPAITCWLYLIKYYSLPAEQKVFIYRQGGIGFETFMLVNLIAIVVSGILYILGSTLLLRRHRFAILNQFSNTEKINLEWLQYLIYGLILIWIAIFADNDETIFLLVVAFIIFIGYFGIRQVGIFTHNNGDGQPKDAGIYKSRWSAYLQLNENTSPPVTTFQTTIATGEEIVQPAAITNAGNNAEISIDKRKYSKSGLTAEAANNLHLELTRLMDEERLYLESELTLTDLAKRLNTHPNYLSQVINEKEQKKLYDYINSLRIAFFKALITKPENQQYTILSLAYECGFNSKSSFNRYFKKATGESPSEYLKNQRIKMPAE